ncbi:phage portal protein family protein [Nocardia sp. NPDC055165]
MADAKKVKIKLGEIGDSGVSLTSGIIVNEEYNMDLVGIRGLRMYDEMRRSDATVRMTLHTMNAPIIAADWEVEAASDSAKDQEIAEMVQENIIEIIKFKKKLEEILTLLPFGFSLFEMILEAMYIKGKLRVGLKDLAFRKQTTITSWETRDHANGVTQQTVRGVFDIPIEKLALFTYQKEGDNYEGISVLRSAYKNWYMKCKLDQIAGIGHERQAVGVPYASYRQGATKEEKRDIEKYLRNLRSNEEAFMMYPQGTEVGFMDMKAGSTSNTRSDADHHDRQISKNSLLQFIEIGASGGSGTRSTSEDHSRLFELAEDSLADYIAQVMTEKVIKTLVDLNFNVTEYPKLRHGKLGDENIPMLSEAVGKFVTAGALAPTAEDENVTRRMIGWRELTEEEIKQRNKEAEEAKKLLQENSKPGGNPDGKDDEDAANKAVTAAVALHASITRKLYGDTGKAA